MNTITIKPPKGLSLKKAKIALKNLNFTIVEEKDETKMSKQEFFTMVDEARAEKGVSTSIESLKNRYL